MFYYKCINVILKISYKTNTVEAENNMVRYAANSYLTKRKVCLPPPKEKDRFYDKYFV